MKILKICFALLICFSIACSTNTAQVASPEHKNHTPPERKSSAEFEKIKSLSGKWESKTSMFGVKDQKVYTEYTVTAGGSAVLEKIFPGTPHEMVSVYYDDDSGKLAMTHYCLMQNRPYFTLVKSSPNMISLDITKVEGLKSNDEASMGAMTLNFKDENHYSSTCESRGKDKHEPVTMNFSRVLKKK